MALPRIGILEACLLVVAVLVLGVISSNRLFWDLLIYMVSVFILSLLIWWSAHLFLNKEKVKNKDLHNYGYSLTSAVFIGILIILMGAAVVNVIGVLILAIILGFIIRAHYKFKQWYKPFLLALGIIIAQIIILGIIEFVLLLLRQLL